MNSNQYDDKYKSNLKKIGNETLDSLDPIIRKVVSNMVELGKEIFNDTMDSAFNNKGKKK